MGTKKFVLGIDLGTSGVRIAILNNNYSLEYFSSNKYQEGLEHCEDWKRCCINLVSKIPFNIKNNLIACSIDGTSGTLMGSDYKGNSIGNALPYSKRYLTDKKHIKAYFENQKGLLSEYESIARAIHIINQHGENILLRHQADWISGWLLNNWSFGEEGNNIKLGWDLSTKSWPVQLKNSSWSNALPRIVPSGSLMGFISPNAAYELGLPRDLKIIAGTTDSNAAVLAANPKFSEGIAVLGSTIVIKRYTNLPITCSGVTNHKVGDKWLTGGASNAGCAVLKKFFSDYDLVELSRQIDPDSDSGLSYVPLISKGERFPVNDPFLEPLLTPRPISDSLFLHGLLEGLAKIEAAGWRKLRELGLESPSKIITIGGGSRNPQWRRIRERLIGIPIQTCSKQPAEGVARLALKAVKR